ncbi:MAG: exopolysaccharide biosynthesis protein [Synechococcaceae cyanobacterium SM2_3_1]|nr:exopolysaccharide biosynthesis protein [Synechococcaceae cyanobacterium SM2_3_1]
MARLSQELERFFWSETCPPRVQLADLVHLTGERAFGFFFVLLSFPSALPIPAPGYSVPFGIVIALLSIQLLAGRSEPWLPQRVLRQGLELKQIQGVLKAGLPWLKRIEGLSKPRLTAICTSVTGRICIGFLITLMACSMMIPVPGTNTLPAIGVFVSGFGLLEDDGALSLAGLCICVLAGIVSTSILLAMYVGGASILDWMRN